MIKTQGLYDLINLIAVICVNVAVFVFFLVRKEFSCSLLRLGYEKTGALREKNKFLNGLFSKWTWIILTAAAYEGIYASYSALVDNFPFLENNTYFTINNYFSVLFFGPILVIGIQFLIGMDFRHGLDLLTPFFALEMAIGKIACFCAGCCYGIEWKGGMYNHTTNKVEFPVQILECFVGFVVAAVLFFLLTRRKTKGKMYPLYMILYSATRFLTEFLRGDHLANWLGMKPYQVLCLIGIAIGAAWLLIIRLLDKYNKRFLYGTDLITYILEKKANK